jgi:hypothetical protein
MPVAFDLARRDVAYTTVQPLAIVVYLDVVEDFLSPYAEWPPATTAYNPQRLSTPIEARSISAKHSPRSSISSTFATWWGVGHVLITRRRNRLCDAEGRASEPDCVPNA